MSPDNLSLQEDTTFDLICGDVIESLVPVRDNYFHGCLCDPPYGLNFMGKKWDHGVPGPEYWSEVLRVLKPGAPILAFGGTRTFHRLACAIEDAGFEIFDSILGSVWITGQGFAKGINISKAIDKALGAERETTAVIPDRWAGKGQVLQRANQPEAATVNCKDVPATQEAAQWEGYLSALKPA